MAYKTRTPSSNVRAQWEMKDVGYKTDLSIEEIRSYGGSQKYKEGGKWINDTIYQSIGGYRSRGGMPLKLQTADGCIPISGTDAEELLTNNIIKSVWS